MYGIFMNHEYSTYIFAIDLSLKWRYIFQSHGAHVIYDDCWPVSWLHVLSWWARGVQSPPKRIVFGFHETILSFGDWIPRVRDWLMVKVWGTQRRETADVMRGWGAVEYFCFTLPHCHENANVYSNLSKISRDMLLGDTHIILPSLELCGLSLPIADSL